MRFKNIIKNKLSMLISYLSRANLDWENPTLLLQAKILMSSKLWRERAGNFDLSAKEFKVFSQWGDDGIIQYLTYVLNIKNKNFIEFGVGSYYESNTHFLLVNNGLL